MICRLSLLKFTAAAVAHAAVAFAAADLVADPVSDNNAVLRVTNSNRAADIGADIVATDGIVVRSFVLYTYPSPGIATDQVALAAAGATRRGVVPANCVVM